MASIIDPVLAKSLIKEYQQQNSATTGPALKTHEEHFLNGFFFDRESLETILNNPKVIGVSVILAKHRDFQGKPGNVFTLLFSGSSPDPDPASKIPLIQEGDMFDGPPPCPPQCQH